MIAIMVSTAALIVVLSVFNGFEGLVKSLYTDFYSDIRIVPATGKFIQFNDALVKKINSNNGVLHSSFTVEERAAVIMHGDYQSHVFLKGVDKNYLEVSKLNKYLIAGNYNTGTTDVPEIVAGIGIANAVGADPSTPDALLTLYLPNRKATRFTSLDAMHSYDVIPAGIFAVQQEFDDQYVFTNLAFVQYMLDLQPDEYSAMEIAIKPGEDVDEMNQQLQQITGNKYNVQTRFEQNQSLFTVMRIERWVIYGILSIILFIAAFNMIGALTMLVLEKEKDIAVLKAMGASNKRIQNIFLTEGFLLGGIGGIAGMLIAFILCWLQVTFHLIKLQGLTFIISYYPVEMNPGDFVLVAVTVTLIALAASWLPAKKAAAQLFSLKS